MRLLVTVFSLLLSVTFLYAGSGSKRITAIRTAVAPRVDGLLTETEWQLAHPVSDFLQYDPLEGNQPTQRTEIRILYDDEALYVGARMFDTNPAGIVARLARRDDEVEADWISVRIDSYHDHQTAFEFTLNAAGVRTDILVSNDAREEDASWDVVWDAETIIDDHGWSAEMKIPFSVLRFPDSKDQEWGIQFIRYISRLREIQHWVLIRRRESGFVSKFGHLDGLENISKPSNIEILPYVVGGNRFVPRSAATPNGREFTSNVGLDLKFKPWAGLTVDATINPDFGQVEADPAVLNLSTFETFYPEKRPFFIEGSQIIRFTTFGGEFGPGLFYSRRIGRAFRLDDPPGGYIENAPRFAKILGAAKISGKTADGLSIGILEAVTDEETATFVDSLGTRSKRVVAPLTNYSLIRLRKDVLENSNAGLMLTSVSGRGRTPAMTAGTDWSLKFLESVYRVEGFLAGSSTTGPTGNRITGSAGKASFNKDGGPHWRGFVSFDFTTKQYDINDLGFFRRPNDYGTVSQILYRDDEVTDWKRIYNLSLTYHLRRNFDGVNLFDSWTAAGYLMFPNFWEINTQAELNDGKFDDRETRGNGLFRRARSYRYAFSVETDRRQVVVADLGISLANDVRSMTSVSVDTEVEVKAASNILLEFNVGRSLIRRNLAWVTNTTDPAVSSSTISVFADRTTSEWDFTTRGSFVFARNLTLQLYLQVFLAKGKYENFVRMTSPSDFVAYPFTWSDFNTLSLNSNLVLRWEYLPGSTLYLVWSQARAGDRGAFGTPFRDDFSNVFSLPMTNVVLLKISYWLNF